MNIYFSTNAIRLGEFEKVFTYLEPYKGKVGIELFPQFHAEGFEKQLDSAMEKLSQYEISCHSPYFESEYSAKKGTQKYNYSIELLEKTLEKLKNIPTKYMVFHHNNRSFQEEEREELLSNARENYPVIKELCNRAGIPLAVENAGVKNTMLLDEDEFIQECKDLDCPVLIDIGHAHANGWNLERVMEELKDCIVSYHLHNNDGIVDGHQRIHNGSLDFERFMEAYTRFTPEADLVIEYCPEAADDIQGVYEDFDYLLGRAI